MIGKRFHFDERVLITMAIRECRGDRTLAARLLGITEASLSRKMRDLGLLAEATMGVREVRAKLEAAAREADEKLRDALTKALRSVKSTERQGPASHLAKRLATPPGSRLRHWLRPLVSRRFYDEVVSQTIADACDEWLEAHTRDEVRTARLIHLRLFVQLAVVLGRGFLGGIVRSAIGIFKSG